MISDTNVYFCNQNISLQTGEARKMVQIAAVREQTHKFGSLFSDRLFSEMNALGTLSRLTLHWLRLLTFPTSHFYAYATALCFVQIKFCNLSFRMNFDSNYH